ncbi:MAG: LamG domain-containing protein, partial [Candidatus Aenigmatarchaeota archaeon]
ARLFINGIQHGPTKSISNLQLADTNRNLTIGKLSGMAHFYNGTIDEVRIYNRTLTAEEISDLYNNYGYSTLNYPGRTLVRKYSYPEPTIIIDNEENSTVFLYFHYSGAPTGSLGKSFIYFSNLKNGSSIQNNFEIDCNLGKDCMLSIRELNLTINDIDKIRVCSKYCLDVCNDVIFK